MRQETPSRPAPAWDVERTAAPLHGELFWRQREVGLLSVAKVAELSGVKRWRLAELEAGLLCFSSRALLYDWLEWLRRHSRCEMVERGEACPMPHRAGGLCDTHSKRLRRAKSA